MNRFEEIKALYAKHPEKWTFKRDSEDDEDADEDDTEGMIWNGPSTSIVHSVSEEPGKLIAALHSAWPLFERLYESINVEDLHPLLNSTRLIKEALAAFERGEG